MQIHRSILLSQSPSKGLPVTSYIHKRLTTEGLEGTVTTALMVNTQDNTANIKTKTKRTKNIKVWVYQ